MGDARKPEHVAMAADLIADGKTVGFFNRSVCALLGSGDTRAFPDDVIRIKGEKRRSRPVGCILPAATMVAKVDGVKIPAPLRMVFTSATLLQDCLAGLAFARVPLREDFAANIPEHLLSRRADGTAVLMGCDPDGYAPLRNVMLASMARGVRIMAGTSMNPSGSPEITRQQDGIDFARHVGLPMFLGDPLSRGGLHGSPTVLSVDADALRLIRDSFLPVRILEQILGYSIKRADDMREARQDQISFEEAQNAGLSPSELRELAIAAFDALT